MHELFTVVLSRRDLSRAGDLFSVADAEIVDDLTDVLAEIDTIISQPDYQHNTNDQSVVEICVTRVLSCIRETKTAERYCNALVALLSTCLRHNLKTSVAHKADPPHAKISADIISSIFLNYNKQAVMQIALPVAVQFLHKGNAELSRNLASYLSLAAIEYAALLSPHVLPILDAIGTDSNFGLCRLLPQIYEVSPQPFCEHIAPLVGLLQRCADPERLAILQLFAMIACQRPASLDGSVSALCDLLRASPGTAHATMQVLLPLAEQPVRSGAAAIAVLVDRFDTLIEAARETPATVTLAAQIMAAAGKLNKDKAQQALDFVLEHLPHADRNSQVILLHEATTLCSTYPILFNEKVLACVRQRNHQQSSSTGSTANGTALSADTPNACAAKSPAPATPSKSGEVNKTSGGITIVKLNAAPSPLVGHSANVEPAAAIRSSKQTKLMNGHPHHQHHPLQQPQHHQSSNARLAQQSLADPEIIATPSPHVVTINTTSSSVSTSAALPTSAPPLLAAVHLPAHRASAVSPPSTIHQQQPYSHQHHTQHYQQSVAPTSASSSASGVHNTSNTSTTSGGYTRRAKLGDSRSTGRLHSAGNTHRSMTRLNIAGGSVGGLHKSMTRLSSSQQINQHGVAPTGGAGPTATTTNSNSGQNMGSTSGHIHSINTVHAAAAAPSPAFYAAQNYQNYVTPVPPLSSNVIITGHSRWGIPATKITSGGVTVTTATSPPPAMARNRPHSQGPTTLGMGSTGALGAKLSGSALNQSTGSIGLLASPPHSPPPTATHMQILAGSQLPTGAQSNHHISVHHAAAAIGQQSPKSVMTLPVNATFGAASTAAATQSNEVIVSGPATVTSRRNNDNTSVTLLNHSSSGGGAGTSIINQRMSTFEPYQIMRDTVQQFCEKHFASIKEYMDKLSHRLPPPTRCGIEERRTKKVAKLHFACQIRGPHCLYSKTCFTMRTRNPKTWIHLMFLDFQIRNYVKDNCALSTREPGISNLKNMWNMIRTENKSFTELVTSNFPSIKEQETLVNELRHSGFLDVFEVSRTDRSTPNANELEFQWGCFLCNHPEKAVGFLHGTNQPMIEGQLKEKKGKWRLFRRWRTRYFTLSGAHLSCKGSSGGESIDVNQIRSVKVSRGARNIPKAFEIFTGDQTLILKPKDGKNAEEWVQCLSIVVAHSQARDNPMAKTNSLPARGLGNSRTAF